MLPFRSQRLRLAGSLLASSCLLGSAASFGVMAASAAPLASCNAPILDLANPSPGAMLIPGAYEIDGVAMDPMASSPQQNSGISDVAVFLDSRDAGGMLLGDTTTGFVPSFAPSDEEALPTVPNPGAFRLIATLPNSMTGEHSIVAYARSALTGEQTVVSVPVVLGEDPSKAGLTAPALDESNSNPGAAPGNCASSTPGMLTTAPVTPAPMQPAPAVAPAAETPQGSIALQLENPSGGDTVHVGGDVLNGVAFDSSNSSGNGSGIDRISFVLGDRDEGGIDLLDITPTANQFSATVNFPANHLGAQVLHVYAHSSLTDAVTSVAVPITVVQ